MYVTCVYIHVHAHVHVHSVQWNVNDIHWMLHWERPHLLGGTVLWKL